MNEHTTNATALAAITSPAWLDYLSGVSAKLLPLVGVLWLLTQIVCKLMTFRGRARLTAVAEVVAEHRHG